MELSHDRAFWIMSVAFLLITIAVQGTVVHLTPLMMDRGYTPTEAAGVMALYGIAMLIARFILGALLDHWSPRIVAMLGCTGPLAACALLASGQPGVQVVLAAVLLGIGAGAEADLLPYAAARHFNSGRLGQVLGVFIFVFAIGVGFGPMLFAYVQTAFGSYFYALYASCVLMAVAILIFYLFRSEGMIKRGGM